MKNQALISALFSVAAWSQVSGPTPGYVFDAATAQLRPMRGMAGTAYLGAAVIDETTAASASEDGTLALASRLGSVELVRGLDSASATRIALTQEPGAVLFAWARHDVAAVFTETKKAKIWRGVDTKTDSTVTIDLAGIAGEIRSARFDGDRLILAASDGLYVSNGGEVSRLLEAGNISSILIDGANLFVADRELGQIVMIRNYGSQAATERFAEVAEPVGMQMSRGRLLVASAESRRVDAYDVTTGARTGSIELDFLPTRMESLGSRPLALLNSRTADEPLYVLDSNDALQVYFVPAGRDQ